MKKRVVILAVSLLLVLASFQPSSAVVETNLDFSTGDPVFNRPVAGAGGTCGGLSSVGTAVHYDTYPIYHNGGNLVVETASGLDTYLVVYSGSFDSANPLTNCVAADDDSSGSGGNARIDKNLAAGDYIVVATTYTNSITGIYDMDFQMKATTFTGQLTDSDPTFLRPNEGTNHTCATGTATTHWEQIWINHPGGPLHLILDANNFDGVLSVYSQGACAYLDDDTVYTNHSTLVFSDLPAGDYAFVVWGYGPTSLGAYHLTVSDIYPDTTGVFRPTNGNLYMKNQNTTGFADLMLTYGLPGDKPVVGDWNGDGIRTLGIYRNGNFYLRNSNTNGFADIVFAFGTPGDLPVAGDWDGDGIETVGVYHNGTFLLRNSTSAGSATWTFSLGVAGDLPIAGDWTGKGYATCGVFRPTNGALYLKNTNATGFADITLTYGLPGDKPVTGDWDGNGTSTIGIYRNGAFYLRNSNTNGFANVIFSLGINGDLPIAGDWNGLP